MPMHGEQPISIASQVPGLEEGVAPPGGGLLAIQRQFAIPLGPPLLVDGVTYKEALFAAPCNGCLIKELWVTGAVSIAGGTNTLDFEKYDASANAGVDILATANWDPTGVTAKEGSKMTLTTTKARLLMNEGDVLWATLVCGTMTTDGEGYLVTVVVLVPEVAP